MPLAAPLLIKVEFASDKVIKISHRRPTHLVCWKQLGQTSLFNQNKKTDEQLLLFYANNDSDLLHSDNKLEKITLFLSCEAKS